MSISAPDTSRRWAWVALALLALFVAVATWSRWNPDGGGEDLAAAEGAVVWGGAGEAGPDVSSGTRLAVPVEVDTVRRGTLVIRVSATGQTEASHRAAVSAPGAGRISSILVEESDRVGGGQVVARLDAREALLAVRQAEAGLAEAEARYREMTLFDDRIEDPAVRRERAKAARARSGLDRAEAAVSRARLDLGNTALAAPFSGRIANVLVGPGEIVAAGEDLLTVVDLSPILVEVQIVESELRWLREGSRAEVRLPALPDTVLRGRIRSINPVVDPATRSARVTVVLANPEGRILPGMFAEVRLEGRSFEDRILVIEEAIVDRDGRTVVFVFEPFQDGPPGEGSARWVYVTSGLSNDRFVELVEGEGTEIPGPGTLVVTAGNYTLIHDARVRIAGRGSDRGGTP
ncbi:MAG TPA: efflux RND transporter periplasmic adaptor subunit [Gemmatimonadota bacterium]|nr:efflux RND transporter periplasmic adaptor subunit [Gemmatimonadota bacterium]